MKKSTDPKGRADEVPRDIRQRLAQGDRKLLEQYIEMCLQDTRDVMLNAEYETDSKRQLVRVRDFAKPFGSENVGAGG
jgi:hypothetical protein